MTDDSNPSPNANGAYKVLRPVLLVALPLVAVIAGLGIYWLGGRYVATDNAYVKADVVPISSEVSAAIAQVLVQENQTVAAGDVLFELRAEPFELAVAESAAQLQQTHADLAALQASYREKQAQIQLARGNHEFAKKELQRQRDLKGKNFVSESTLDDLQHTVETSRQQLQVLDLDLQKIAASLGGNADAPLQQHPAYLAAKAKLAQNQLALSRTQVTAPVSGIVSQVPSPGQYVHTGNTVAAIVETGKVWVEANFSEIDLTHVRTGQHVEVTIDTYPDMQWTGLVESISPATGSEFAIIPAQNATGNWVKIAQRVPVRIQLTTPPNAPPLRSGLSAIVEIDTQHQRTLFGKAFRQTNPQDQKPARTDLVKTEND